MFKLKLTTTYNQTTDSIDIVDNTGLYPTDATGYNNASYLPQVGMVFNKFAKVRKLNKTAVDTGTVVTTSNKTFSLPTAAMSTDGVYVVETMYSRNSGSTITPLVFKVNPTSNTVLAKGVDNTVPWSGSIGILEGVNYVTNGDTTVSGTELAKVVFMDETTLTVKANNLGITDLSALALVYSSEAYVLILCKLDYMIAQSVKKSIKRDSCEVLEDNRDLILGREAIQKLFDCGDYYGAQELLNNLLNTPMYATTCGCK